MLLILSCSFQTGIAKETGKSMACPDQMYVLASAPAVTVATEASPPANVLSKSVLFSKSRSYTGEEEAPDHQFQAWEKTQILLVFLKKPSYKNMAPVKGSLPLSWSE